MRQPILVDGQDRLAVLVFGGLLAALAVLTWLLVILLLT